MSDHGRENRETTAPQSPVAEKVRIALEARDAMREYRNGKPIAFQFRKRP